MATTDGVFNIEIQQGDRFDMELTILDDQANPVDLSTHSFSGQVRKTAGTPGEPYAEFSFILRDQAVLATKGQVLCFIPGDETRLIPVPKSPTAKRVPAVYAYDIHSVIGGSPETRERWVQGLATVDPEVTT